MPGAHQFNVGGLEYYYWWRLWFRATDKAGNRSGWTATSGCM